ncbi:MAG: FKBP-type peptidyl-prolyl cis-trans isomerase [Thaumarchaeota archaeon]|nr:FKBP-type peptidyl-prolyl cis-trans isomerase [Nitrososphaerota archaeon]
MSIEKGSLVYINYTARIKDTNELIETTSEAKAKKLGTHDPTKRYEPKLVCVGEGWVLQGLDEVLQKRKVGDKLVTEVDPDKGFGKRDPSQVRMLPLKKFGEKAHEMSVGDEVEVDGRVGIVRYIGSGRSQVDFNHRLAGKTIVYDLEIVKKLEGPNEKIKALIRRRLPVSEEKLKTEISKNILNVWIPEEHFLTEGLQIIKKAVSTDVFKFLPDISKVVFTEEHLSSIKPEKTKQRDKKSKSKSATASIAKSGVKARAKKVKRSKPSR